MDYLPRGDGNAKAFGGIHVTVKQITQKSDYTLTTLRIANNKVRVDFIEKISVYKRLLLLCCFVTC